MCNANQLIVLINIEQLSRHRLAGASQVANVDLLQLVAQMIVSNFNVLC